MAETSSIEHGRFPVLSSEADSADSDDLEVLAAECFWWDPCILRRRSH